MTAVHLVEQFLQKLTSCWAYLHIYHTDWRVVLIFSTNSCQEDESDLKKKKKKLV